MKRFSASQASAVAARVRARQQLSALLTFTSALHHSIACFSGETSKAYSSAKKRPSSATSATAPVPGAAAAMTSSSAAAAAAPAKLSGSRSHSRAAVKGRKSATAASPSQQPQAPPSTRSRRQHGRGSAAPAMAIADGAHVQPMRGRRPSEPPRQRRTTKQKAAALLQIHLDEEKTIAAETHRKTDSPFPTAEPRVEERGSRRPSVSQGVVAGEQEVLSAASASSLSSSPAQATTEAVDAASLTTAQLLARVEMSTFMTRVVAQVRDWATAMREWAQPSSDPTLREWERQLVLSLRKDSFSDCTVIQSAMQQRYEDQFGHSSHDVAFLTLYARVLMNNAVFCLLNFVTYRATALLTEALKVAEAAYTLKQQQDKDKEKAAADAHRRGSSSGSIDEPSFAASTPTTASKKTKKGDNKASAIPSPALMSDPENYLVFLRVLLANAYASDQQYWKAAEQYQHVLTTLERSPLWTPEQLSPGLTSPRPLNHAFVEEDARLFYADPARVDHAVSQGTAQLLLLQSQGIASNAVRLMHAQLAMARLHRHAGRYAESQSFYESYLDGAAEHMEGEDVGGVMLELGRLLLYKMRNEDAALVYLEAASNILLEDAQDLLLGAAEAAATTTATTDRVEVDSGAEARVAAGNASHRAASALIDTAMAHHAQGKTGKAIGLLEGCLQLLEAAGLGLVGGWVREQYADMLATVSLVDRALEEYTRAMELLRHDCGDAVEQIGPGGRLVALSSAEVEGHLAFCLQTYVGDHKRAMAHYRNVMQGTYRANPLIRSAQSKLSKRARRQRAGNASATAAARRDGETRMRVSSGSTSSMPSIDLSLQPDVLHWVLSNYVACCERVGAFAEAVGVQNRLIEIEGALGGNVVDSYLKLISLQQQSGEVEKTLALCFYVFYLPDAMMPPQTRLEVANCFASSCHQLGNNRMGSVLMQAVQQVRGDHDANALVHYAMCLKALDPADRLQLDGMMDIEASIHAIGTVFRRAASIVVADIVLDNVEATTTAATASSAASSSNDLSTTTTSWTHDRVERALNGLIVLSRGAFFFHQNRFMKDAADLYAHALEQVDRLAASMPVLTDALQREMGILLVNYATLKAAEDPKLAATLYERAAAVCPSYLEVAEVVADFFVQSGDYAKGSVYMKRVLRANPAAAADMHLRLARLGTGPAWETMSYGQRMEVLEHLLKGLGVSAERIAAACTMTTQRQLSSSDDATTAAAVTVSLTDVAQLLMDGVATTMSEDAVCLATYVVQTRFHEPQLLNRMYRRALLRFPQHATILVNYATLCMYSGYHVLARKYIAKAYAASSGDLNCTMCYAHYLCRSYDDQQIAAGASLYSDFLERYPNSAQAHAAFANFMAGVMPTPFKTEEHFKRALELAPKSEDVVLQYGQFMWACTDSKNVYTNDEVRRRVFDRAEQLFKEAVDINPKSFTACHQLGTFYANRHNRFEEAMTMLYRAHKLQPGNVEVLRHILNTMHEECARVQREEQRQSGAIAGQGGQYAAAASQSSRLRSLTSNTRDMFENVLSKEPNDRATLERYARFAVETLRDPSLAASLYSRIQQLNRK